MLEYVAVVIFVLVYVLIVGRIKFKVPIWASMLIGAVLMVGFQVISPESALKAVQLDVLIFLFGMFSIVSALDRSGVLKVVASKMLSKAKSANNLLLIFVVGIGLLAAFFVNDTLALVGIPLVVYISKQIGIRPVVLLIALAFSITIGSTMTPIGNPQNLLIAIQSGISLPFTNFLKFLAVPTMVNLFVTYYILKIYFKKDLVHIKYHHIEFEQVRIEDKRLAKISVIVLVVTVIGFFISEILHFLNISDVSISTVALGGAAVLYALSGQRLKILQNVEYSVLVFFAAMFVVTAALWSSGSVGVIMKHIPNPVPHDIWQSNAVISVTSVTVSQILSNVPFVALYHYVMVNSGFTGMDVSQWMMLAAASTIAGNLTILAAASNIIIIQAAESRGVKAFTFLEFFKIGSIVTAANLVIFYLFIAVFSVV